MTNIRTQLLECMRTLYAPFKLKSLLHRLLSAINPMLNNPKISANPSIFCITEKMPISATLKKGRGRRLQFVPLVACKGNKW